MFLFQSSRTNEDCVAGGLRIAGLIVGATACFLFVVHYPILTAIIALSMITAILFYCAEKASSCNKSNSY